MAAATREIHLERVEAAVNDDVSFPFKLITTWEGTYNLGTGGDLTGVVVVETPLVDTSPLDQAAWDAVWGDVQTAWAAVTTVAAPSSNPIVI